MSSRLLNIIQVATDFSNGIVLMTTKGTFSFLNKFRAIEQRIPKIDQLSQPYRGFLTLARGETIKRSSCHHKAWLTISSYTSLGIILMIARACALIWSACKVGNDRNNLLGLYGSVRASGFTQYLNSQLTLKSRAIRCAS